MAGNTTTFSSRDDILSAFAFDLSNSLLSAAKIGPAERTRISALWDAYAGDSRTMSESSFVECMASLGVRRPRAAVYFRGFNTSRPVGVLDYHQFEVGLIAMDPMTPHGGAWGAERLTYIFSLYDVDGDSAISGPEFAAMVADIARAKAKTSIVSEGDTRARAADLWIAVFGFASLAEGELDFRAFHTAVGEMKIRGTSKLFRLKGSPIHSPDHLGLPSAGPTSHLLAVPGGGGAGFSTPGKRGRAREAPISPMMSPFSSPGAGTPGKAKATLYWKHMTPARETDYASALARREAHAMFMSEAHGSAARKKVNFIDPDIISTTRSPTKAQDGITSKVINPLLLSGGSWSAPARGEAFTLLSVSEMLRLASRAQTVMASEPTLVEAEAPFKVYGDVHGQITELLEFFTVYGSPQHVTGDIEFASYCFMGDFVDRGPNSLEVVALLFSLKVRYPDQILLIRGNHEDPQVNELYGFKSECIDRLGKRDGTQVWEAVNEAFSYLPLAGLIGEEIFCCHGGIGGNVSSLDSIRAIPKPIVVSELTGPAQLIVRDLLWSDPTTSDCVVGIHANSRGPDVTTFGPDRVRDFCISNNISMIARAHECVQDGFEAFAAGHLLTCFSATSYQGTYDNDGAYLEITKNLKVTPKIIPSKNRKPQAPPASASAAAASSSSKNERKFHIPIQHHELQEQKKKSAGGSKPRSSAKSMGSKIVSDLKENNVPRSSGRRDRPRPLSSFTNGASSSSRARSAKAKAGGAGKRRSMDIMGDVGPRSATPGFESTSPAGKKARSVLERSRRRRAGRPGSSMSAMR